MRSTQAGLAVGLAVITATSLMVAAPSQAADRVPVANGRYGDIFGPEALSFKVRNRTIIDPRISVWVQCRHSDGTSSDVLYGVTGSDPDRRFRVPRDGSATVSWVQEWDNSLIEDATISLGYTFRERRPALASVTVEATYSEMTEDGLWTSVCEGYTPFRLRRGPLNPAG